VTAAATKAATAAQIQSDEATGFGGNLWGRSGRRSTIAPSEGGGGNIRGTSTKSGASPGVRLGGGRTAPRAREGTSSFSPGTRERSQPEPGRSRSSTAERNLERGAGLAHSTLVQVSDELA
jgi:hypothetical protein